MVGFVLCMALSSIEALRFTVPQDVQHFTGSVALQAVFAGS